MFPLHVKQKMWLLDWEKWLPLILVAAGSEGQTAKPKAELGAAARCLSCIADVLVCMAGGKGGLRSGPAANELWSSAYALLEKGDLKGGVKALAVQRQLWLSRWDFSRQPLHYCKE